MHDIHHRFLEQVLDETVKSREGLKDALKKEMHMVEKRKLSRALAHLDRSIELITEVVGLNYALRCVEDATKEIKALGIITDG